MNSGVFAARPSEATFEAMLAALDAPGAFWKRTDQTFLQHFFPDWNGLTVYDNMLQYVWFNMPDLWDWSMIRVLHFQYEKPWQQDHPKAEKLQPLIDLWRAFYTGEGIPGRHFRPPRTNRRGHLMHVLLTGGTGYVGRFIAEKLHASNHELILLGRNGLSPHAFHPWSLTDPSPVLPRADALVHCAYDHVPAPIAAAKAKIRKASGPETMTARSRSLTPPSARGPPVSYFSPPARSTPMPAAARPCAKRTRRNRTRSMASSSFPSKKTWPTALA